jgi:hypothetical protein
MENNYENYAKLAKKLAIISKELGAVAADAENAHDRYAYISYEKVNAVLRNILEKNGIAIIPNVENYQESQYKTAKGSMGIRTVVTIKFLIVDTETGFSIERSFVGADQDTKGKSMSQAITECQKRFELKLFHISTKGDVDPDSKSEEADEMIPPELASAQQWDDIAFALHGKSAKELSGDEKKSMKETIKKMGYSVKLTKDAAAELINKLLN